MQSPQAAVIWTAGGGPAPGINNVLRALTLGLHDATSGGIKVLGVPNGFGGTIKGRVEDVRVIEPGHVEHIGALGGCVLGMRRDAFKNDGDLETAMGFVRACEERFGVRIVQFNATGGDDTLTSLNRLATALLRTGRSMDFVHHPKTIDMDYGPAEHTLCSPWSWAPTLQIQGPPTFGYSSACEHWARNVILPHYLDVCTNGAAWQIDQFMGRYSGWLVHGAAALAEVLLERLAAQVPGFTYARPLVIVPEMFNTEISLEGLVKICAAAIERRMSHGSVHGMLLISEGIIPLLDRASRAAILGIAEERVDPHGHIDLESFDLLGPLARKVKETLEAGGKSPGKIRVQKFGYDARCQPPNEFDTAYTSAIGAEAASRARQELVGSSSLFYDGTVRVVDFQALIGSGGRVSRVDIPSELAWKHWVEFSGECRPPNMHA